VNTATFVGTVEELALSSENDGAKGLFVRIVKERVEKMPTSDDKDDNEAAAEEKELSTGVTKLGVGVEGGFQSEEDKFDTVSTYSIVLLQKVKEGGVEIVAELGYEESTKADFPTQVSLSADSIINHSGLAVQQDLKAWELDAEPKPVSKYYDNLPFVDNGVKVSPNPSDWKCQKSGDTENLWLNLSDGYIGGGRKNWDGSGGSNGALDHFNETGEKYPLVVKLGTITVDVESADCYSYAKDEDGPVKIPNLAKLLEKRGIMVAGLQKTVKSTAELEVELNATYAFDAITESGANLTPVSGPGLQGLQNLGNSCYINSIVQALFSGTVPELSSRYGTVAKGSVTDHPLLKIPPSQAHLDVLTQTAKLANALTSGTFAGPIPPSVTVTDAMSSSATDPKYRLAPRMFKYAIARNHVDFCTGQQQDAAQFLQYLLETLDRAELGANSSRWGSKGSDGSACPLSSHLFAYKTTSRLVCGADKLIKYTENALETTLSLRVPMEAAVFDEKEASAAELSSPEQKRQKSETTADATATTPTKIPKVSFQSCIDAWAASSTLDDYRWPHLKNAVSPATSQLRMSNFPRYLMIQMQRYELGPDWTPRKLEVDIDVPLEIDLSEYNSRGPQEGEALVPSEELESQTSSGGGGNATPKIDEGAMGQLMDMGFGFNGCQRALAKVGGSNVEAAMNWIFEHSTDPDFNDPLPDDDVAMADGNDSSSNDVDEGVVMSLVENLGCFTADHVRAALKETGGAADRAADWLFSHMDNLDAAITSLQSKDSASFETLPSSSPPLDDGDGKYTLIGLVSHIGKNTGSGHYVCHLKKDGKWVIFNDEKVALSESPPVQHAYVYLFKRSDTIGSPNLAY